MFNQNTASAPNSFTSTYASSVPVKTFRWQIPPTDESTVQNLQAELGIAPLFCRLLVQRGITTKAEARLFFKPQLDDLLDPFLMKDMDLAVERLEKAVANNERILLYGDYDVDGTTSVAMMHAFLAGFYQNLDYYLPDREKEGYGVSLEGVEYARETGCGLIVAIDCGIKAHKAVTLAKSYGIDFVVCDHHLPEGDVLPESVANLDPKRSDCPYPYKELSGCGIAFKLAQAMSLKRHIPVEEITHLLDLVAVSIACDIVPMSGENRVMAYFGLQQINREPRLGLGALINQTNREYPLSISDLVFGLGPIINSAGRLGDAREAVRLMLATDRNHALDEAKSLFRRNRQRQAVDVDMTEAAHQSFRALPDWQARKSIVLYDPSWHKGVIGIAASRMTEAFHRPAVILTLSNERAVGSARSVHGFDLYLALEACQDLFYSFGGHAFAAGMQMPVENIPAFTERFEMLVRRHLEVEDESPLIEISARIRLEDITPGFWKMLKRFEPFGPHNRSPVFWASGLVDTGKSRQLDNNHLRLSVRHADGRKVFSGIGFGIGDRYELLKNGPVDMAFAVREESWRGSTALSLMVKDVRASEG
ncbi:MAG: single-stranded-DNA-specific exonuclease RecJ [Bacteroidota bacterium]